MWVAKHLHDLNFSKYLLQVLLIQLGLIDDLYSDLGQGQSRREVTDPFSKAGPARKTCCAEQNTQPLPQKGSEQPPRAQHLATRGAGSKAASCLSGYFPSRGHLCESRVQKGFGLLPVTTAHHVHGVPSTVLQSRLFLSSWVRFKQAQTFVFAPRNPFPKSHHPASLCGLPIAMVTHCCPSTSPRAAVL